MVPIFLIGKDLSLFFALASKKSHSARIHKAKIAYVFLESSYYGVPVVIEVLFVDYDGWIQITVTVG